MKKNTKSALLLSVVSIIVCCTMLLGTTMAWFTDSVTSARNQIVAGNLDVELTYEVEGDFVKVTDQTKLFSEVKLWEPGVVVYETIKVANVGNLALKYNFELAELAYNTVTVDNVAYDLSDVIKVGVVTNADTADRNALVASVDEWFDLDDFVLASNAELLAGEETEPTTIVLYWAPSDSDNIYNLNNGKVADDNTDKLYIEFGLNLFATQLTYEEDSFDNEYDESATATRVSTAEDLIAAIANGGEIALANDITISSKLNITSDTVIYGLGNTLTYTGGDRAIDVTKETNGADLTIKDLVIDINSGYCERGINYNTNGTLVLDNVTLGGGTKATYGVNLPGSSDGAKVEIVDCDITALIALNVWGENAVVNVTDSNLSNYDKTEIEDYVAVALNSDGSGNAAEGAVVTIIGGSVTAKDQNGDPCIAFRNMTATGSIFVSGTTVVGIDGVTTTAATVRYKDGNGNYYNEFYACSTLQDAIDKAAESSNAVVVLIGNREISESITVNGDVVLDLNGYTLTTTNTTDGLPIYLKSGKLTVLNGTLALDGSEESAHGTYNSAIGYEPDTELVVDNVTFKGVTGINGTWKADGAVKISVSNSTFEMSSVGIAVCTGSADTVATITDCNITASGYAVFGSQGSKITVNGGTYNSAVAIYAQDAGTIVTIEAGTFTGALNAVNGGEIVIKGGTFSVDPSAYLADGYVATESNGTWTVTAE